MHREEAMCEHWRLGSVASTARPGGFIDGDWIETPYITDKGIRLVQTGNIGVGEFLDKPDSRRFISEKSFHLLGCKWVYADDILICRLADPIGKSCLVPAEIAPCITAVDCTIYRPDLEIVDPRFILQVLNWEPHLNRLRDLAGGSTRQRISRTNLGEATILLPPLPEQCRIAAILDAADEAIRAGERVIAKLRQVKAGALHDLLTCGVDAQGRLRDPRAHPEQFKDSPLGRIPREWEISRIIDISVGGISNGFFKKPELVGSGYTLINVLDLYQDFGIDLGLVERVRASEQEQQKYAVQAGDCFFTRSSLNLSGIAHCNIIREVTEPTLFECHLMRVRPNQKMVVPEFVALWCRSSWAHRYLMAQAKQVTMTTIAQPDLAPMLVPLPLFAEQTRIAAILDAHDARLRAEETAVAKLRQVKAGLMEDLLTGRVRSKAL